MHEQGKNKYSTDYYLYKGLNKIAPGMCWLSPNIVTLISALLIIPIIINILKDQSALVFIILLLVRHILDCLDGTIARKCEKTSTIGAYLDMVFDYIFFLALYIAILYKIMNNARLQTFIKKNPFKLILIMVGILFFGLYNCYFIWEIVELSGDKKTKTNKWNQYIQDNETIMFILVGILIKYITNVSF